jgi:hypothetical protein
VLAAAFQATTVAIRQSGNAPVTITASSVSFSLDDARTLRVSLVLTSHARAPLTISVRGTLYAGDGSIASALFEASIPLPLITPAVNPAPASQIPAFTPPPG